jgi:hypothetical protein
LEKTGHALPNVGLHMSYFVTIPGNIDREMPLSENLCGTLMCIAGTAAYILCKQAGMKEVTIKDIDFISEKIVRGSKTSSLFVTGPTSLFYPPRGYTEPEPRLAAKVIRNYLTFGQPMWEVAGKPGFNHKATLIEVLEVCLSLKTRKETSDV